MFSKISVTTARNEVGTKEASLTKERENALMAENL